MTNIERMLKEKSVLEKLSKKVYDMSFFTHNELKFSGLLSISFMTFAMFFTDYFFENDHGFLGFFSLILGSLPVKDKSLKLVIEENE